MSPKKKAAPSLPPVQPVHGTAGATAEAVWSEREKTPAEGRNKIPARDEPPRSLRPDRDVPQHEHRPNDQD